MQATEMDNENATSKHEELQSMHKEIQHLELKLRWFDGFFKQDGRLEPDARLAFLELRAETLRDWKELKTQHHLLAKELCLVLSK